MRPETLRRNILIAAQNYEHFQSLTILSSDMMLHRHQLLLIK